MRFIFLTLISFSLLTAKVNNGDILPPLALVDQFDNKVEIRNNATLIVSFQKSVSSEIQAYLDAKPKHFLEQNNILYVSDMSVAPTFMIKLFGIPKMKKFDYKVALIYDDAVANTIQREDDKVTVIQLKRDKIVNIQFVSPKDLNSILDN
jgi:transcription initiation factor IIF auxiliary subunit